MLYTIIGGTDIIKRGCYERMQIYANSLHHLHMILKEEYKGATTNKYNKGPFIVYTIINKKGKIIFEYNLIKMETK